ncbi:MAG: hypothetical protein HOH88_03435 [Flavobacteriales bacterium]|jgi:hypothetical protein|nr:hypothetical protein [Flavobacteriales bacterium]
MKKMFLTAVVAFSTLAMSAQSILITSEIAKDANDEYSMESLTNGLAFGYEVMDKVIVGITMKDATMNTAAVTGVDSTWTNVVVDTSTGITSGGDYNGDYVAAADEVEDGTLVSDMQFFARYNYTENIFLQLTSPWSVEDGIMDGATDFARLGAGYSMNVWGDINAEANYSMLIKANSNDDRKGKLSLGISMKF